MIANYHSHTTRCFHAVGTETEYLDAAVKRGLKIFGFSDHAPQWYPEGHSSRIRMATDQLEEYCQCIRHLQTQYKGKLEIPLGLEVEYYPDLFDALHDHAQAAGVEYLLLGQHLFEGDTSCAEAWNFGPAEESMITTEYAVSLLQKGWNAVQYTHTPQINAPHETKILRLNCEKAMQNLSWQPVWNAETAFRKTAVWYREYYTAYNILTQKDLDDYIQDAGKKDLIWID